MLRAITVDDELSNHVLLKRFIEKSGQLKVIAQFIDPLTLMDEIEVIKPDVIFLDIEMPVMSGLEVAEKLIPICPGVKIVFVTAYSQYAVEAFRVNALDYLLKPIDPSEMKRVTQKLLENVQTSTEPVIDQNISRINCLGDFAVYGTKSVREVQWVTSKVEELFAYLLRHSPQAVSKAELCNVLWQETDEEKGLVSLYTTVYRLRKSLYESGVSVIIHSNKNGYQVENAGCLIDYTEFERLTEALSGIEAKGVTPDNIEQLKEAEGLFKGELFSNRAYLWSAPYAESLNKKYRLLCYEMSAFYNEQEDFELAATYLDKLLQVFPDEEMACMQRLKIYELQKDEQAAQGLYQSYIAYLKEELNVTPTPEFEKFYTLLFV